MAPRALHDIVGLSQIGGQNEKYLVNALKAYRNGKRQDTFAIIMTGNMKLLSDADSDHSEEHTNLRALVRWVFSRFMPRVLASANVHSLFQCLEQRPDYRIIGN